MTRDFNKQNRDDSRSSSRNNSSNRYGEERSPRPARVRLNRETVDRAWENGAPSLHADYRARSTNGQPPRNNWRSNQNSSPNAPGGNRTYGSRQNNYRDNSQDSERRPNNGYPDSRPRPSGTSRPGGDQPRYNDQRGNGPSAYRSDGPRYNGNQRSNNDSAPYNRSNGPRPNGNQRGPAPYRSNEPRYDGTQRGPAPYRSNEPRYDGTQRGPAPYRPNSRLGFRPAQGQGPQVNKPEGERPRRGAGREVHPEKEYRPRVNELKPPRTERPPHPRFLSRPEVRREREAKRHEEYTEQFEGDYEQFDASDAAPQAERPSRPAQTDRPARKEFQPRPRSDQRYGNYQEPERHVTQMPDGRVLKGPRPVQRKNAEFWTDINNDTEALIEQVQAPASEEVDAEQVPTEEGEQPGAEQPAKRRTPRGKKAEGATKKPRSSGPKPSQKGYKWPTA